MRLWTRFTTWLDGWAASLFRRPALSATIVVPAAQAPLEITPEIQTNIAQVLQEQLGITVHVTAPEQS